MGQAGCGRALHRVLEQKLTGDSGDNLDDEDDDCDQRHNFSSIFATGFATTARPIITIAMPHQRRVEICSARKIQQLSGTSTCTTFESGKAIESGIYFKT